jgi:hypothetical protein
VADLSLDKAMLQDVLAKKKSEPGLPSRGHRQPAGRLREQRASGLLRDGLPAARGPGRPTTGGSTAFLSRRAWPCVRSGPGGMPAICCGSLARPSRGPTGPGQWTS